MHSFSGAAGCTAALYAQYLNYGSSSGHLVTLKWSDPLGASGNDYDMFAFDGSFVTDYSVNGQNGDDDPLEWVGAYPGDYIWVTKFSGAARALRLDTNRARLVISTAGAVVGHNGGDGTISVAATDGRIPGVPNPFVGGTTNPVETYSSDGPRRMFYNPNGTAITPGNVLFGTGGGVDLKKPDITAADCVTTTTPGFIPFCGTSAAAPHAAAIAALLKSADNHPGGGQVLAAMFATALDVTPGAGWDRNSGVGIVMANSAAGVLTSIPAVDFYTLSPCRVFDTREVTGPTGGVPLSCGTAQSFTIVGKCDVPTGTKAVSVNLTGVGSTAQGNLRLYATGAPAPLVSNLNYVAGVNRANNAVAPLSAGGQLSVLCSPSGTTHAVLDVNGYFK
jgi:hypothetical protein